MPKTEEMPAPIGVLIAVPWMEDYVDVEAQEIVRPRYVMPVVNWWIGLEFAGACHGAN